MSPQRPWRCYCVGVLLTFGVLGLTVAAAAQSAPPIGHQSDATTHPLPSRVFIDVAVGYRFGTLDFSETKSDPYFAETKSWTADYSVKSGPSFQVGGGVRVWQGLMCMAAYSRFEDSSGASLTGSVPNPFFFDKARAIAGESAALSHTEQTLHLSALWTAAVSPALEVGVFGGPSIVSLRQSYVRDVLFDDGYPYLTATFTQAAATKESQTAVGFNIGGNVAWFFSRHLGVSGTVRFSRVSASLNTAAGNAVPVNLGGVETAVGLRISGGRYSSREPEHRPSPPPSPSMPPAPRRQPPAPKSELATPRQEEKTAAPPEAAGSGVVGKTAVAKGELPMFIRPGLLTPISTFPPGTRLKILEDHGDWLMVESHDRRWGRRVGFVRRDLITVAEP